MTGTVRVPTFPKAMTKKSAAQETDSALFTRRNWQWLGAGVITIVLGFIALAMGSITLAPLLLVVGYCVLIPVGILVGPRRSPAEPAAPIDR